MSEEGVGAREARQRFRRDAGDGIIIRSYEKKDRNAVLKLFIASMKSLVARFPWQQLAGVDFDASPRWMAALLLSIVIVPSLSVLFFFWLWRGTPFLLASLFATFPIFLIFVGFTLYFHDSVKKGVDRYWKMQLSEDLADIEKHYLANGNKSHFFVAVDQADDDTILGQVALEGKSEKQAELRRMGVFVGARRRGIAMKLCTALLDFAREAGYEEVFLGCSSIQVAAVAMYRKTGFVFEGKSHAFVGMAFYRLTKKLR